MGTGDGLGRRGSGEDGEVDRGRVDLRERRRCAIERYE